VAGRWLRQRRAQVQGIFRSPAFAARPYWDAPAVAAVFDRFCARTPRSGDRLAGRFWRVLTAELWLRVFIDRARAAAGDPLVDGELEKLGDRGARESAGVAAGCRPHPGRHAAMVGADGQAYVRMPVRTRRVWPGDGLAEVVTDGVAHCGIPLRAGDVVIVAEKIVAIGQGRCVPVEQVTVRPLARVLARFVRRTPAGISLGLPEAFELAAREAGLLRILAGTLAAGLTRPLGIRGVFYRITGWEVAAIDSPDADALPPSDRCVKLAPRDPEGAAAELAGHVSHRAGARIEAAVVDVNDIGAEVLGASSGVDRRLLVSLLRDNPLGQDTQQTPVGIVQRAGAESIAPARAAR
jgi:asparagine synthase (glutamine-hydrolysing)